MIAVMAGKVAPIMTGEIPVIDVIGKAMVILQDIHFIRSTITSA